MYATRDTPFRRPRLGMAWVGALLMTSSMTMKPKIYERYNRPKRREARKGKERQNGKGTEHFVITELTPGIGGFRKSTQS